MFKSENLGLFFLKSFKPSLRSHPLWVTLYIVFPLWMIIIFSIDFYPFTFPIADENKTRKCVDSFNKILEMINTNNIK